MNFKTANVSSPPLTFGSSLELSAVNSTDIWRKPPNTESFNAPIIYKSIPISTFKRARVSATGDWKTLYDQGGLVIVLSPKNSKTQQRWIKTGIEFYQEKPMMSVVATDEWSDWSLLPLSAADEKAGKMSVEVERDQNPDGTWGSVLRVLLVGDDGSKMPIREVTWAFWGADESEEMWVGVYAAKPTKDERDKLVAKFEGFEIETRSD